MRYMAPRRNGLTGLGKGRLAGLRLGLSEAGKRPPGRGGAGENTGGAGSGVEGVVLGNSDTSVTGIKDLPADPNGLKPRGSVGADCSGRLVSSD